MDATMEVDKAIRNARGGRGSAKGRKYADKQESVTKPDVIKELIDELVRGYNAAREAKNESGYAIKAAAEASGYNANSVRAFVVARASENFKDKERSLEQQLELFTEIGE